ncbi:PE-PPE domain-containing protein [Mycolicibacterium aurum]|uniref:PE-PPE domain-containing protein n=1 Tax=Mycolicibacterium aurum TaxID=1791 RepID=A0A448ISL1_MYCAU|nr:hypothetical protein [Mycolicibacterium aurum]VEG55462.1 PE-PPE domain-containing protein [Mycolicibacterium aurum]
MHVAVKPVITSGIALVGASVIAVSPVSPVMPVDAPAPSVRVVDSDVSLTASSLAYVPINMIQQALSAPANMVAALDRLATAMAISGSWNEEQPNNVWGWDPANPAMFRETINTLIPFPAFSEPWGRHLDWWATANLPMYEGCAYECDDLPGMLAGMFKVPMSEFYDEDGYTFPTVINPTGGAETEWSGQTVKLDPAEPIESVWNSLIAEPTGVRTTTLWEAVTAFANFSAALQITGHLPTWVAVREIETFVKHFLRAPAVEETAPEAEPDVTQLALVADTSVADASAQPEPAPASTLSPTTTWRTLTTAATPPAGDAPDQTQTTDADPAASSTTETPDLVTTVTTELKKKFASAAPDAEDTGATEDKADVKDDAGTAADSKADSKADAKDDSKADSKADAKDDSKTDSKGGAATGGKHRKADDGARDKSSDIGSSSSSGSGGSGGSGGSSSSSE